MLGKIIPTTFSIEQSESARMQVQNGLAHPYVGRQKLTFCQRIRGRSIEEVSLFILAIKDVLIRQVTFFGGCGVGACCVG